MNAILRMTINENNWAFCPPDHYPRLIRFTLPEDAPAGCIAMLDAHSNLLRVSRGLYDLLTETQQHMVLATMKPLLYLRDLNL